MNRPASKTQLVENSKHKRKCRVSNTTMLIVFMCIFGSFLQPRKEIIPQLYHFHLEI
jgi:hypothetical protein